MLGVRLPEAGQFHGADPVEVRFLFHCGSALRNRFDRLLDNGDAIGDRLECHAPAANLLSRHCLSQSKDAGGLADDTDVSAGC